MHNPWLPLFVAVAPGAVVVLIGLLSALPSFALLRRSQRGRARSAIAYLAGFLAGVGATTLVALFFKTLPDLKTPVVEAGIVAAFLGPFAGMGRANWVRRRRPRRPRLATAQDY
jgi:hypothetical protein